MLGGIAAALVLLTRLPRTLSLTTKPLARVVHQGPLWTPAPAPSLAHVPSATVMSHGDARRTHRARGVGPHTPHVLWKLDLGTPVSTQPVPSADGQSAYVGTLGGDLVRFSLKGALEWRKPLGGRVYGAPVVSMHEKTPGRVYVASDDHALFAFSPEGELQFRLKLDDEGDTPLLLRSDGSLVLGVGTKIVSVSSRGTLQFQFEVKKKVFTAPAEGEAGQIYFGSQDHHAYALSASGALLWKVDLGSDVDGAPAVADDGSIWFGTDRGDVVHVSQAGAVLSRTPVGGYVRGMLSLTRAGEVLAGVYGPNPGLVRVTALGAHGGMFAIVGTQAKEFGVHGGALEDDTGAIFFGAQDNRVYAVETDGKLRFTLQTEGDIDAPLTLLPNGRLLVASEDGNVYCVGD